MKFRLKENIDNQIFYRVTRDENLDTFNCSYPQFFATNLDYAKEYAEVEENPIIYTVNLNINNPFDLSNDEQLSIFNNDYLDWAYNNLSLIKQGIEDNGGVFDQHNIKGWLKSKKLGDKLDFVNADYIYIFLKNSTYNYDGLIVDEGITYGKFKGTLSYVPFYSRQIKIISKEKI